MPTIAPPSAFAPLRGREESLARLGTWLRDGARLVAITGPAGVGKTQLAVTAARSAPLPMVFCDVSEAKTADDVRRSLARSLGLTGDAWGAAAIKRALEARGPSIVLIDNYEQVAPQADTWLGQWAAESEGPHLLVTTRRRLQPPGDHTLELGPLALPAPDAPPETLRDNPAVRLFVERAARAGISLSDELLPVAATIVRTLDGLPLAIELAAAKCRLLTPHEVAQRLVERTSLLGDRRSGQPTLRAALDASWGLLSPAAQHGLARAAVFVGGWDLAAAVSVFGGVEDEVLEVLGELDDQSLLSVTRAGDQRRFRLFATVRDYASEQAIALGQAEEATLLHARHYLAWIGRQHDRLTGPEAERALTQMTRELDNAVAAARFLASSDRAAAVSLVVTLAPIFEHQVPTDAYVDLLEHVLGADDVKTLEAALGPDLYARALVAMGRALAVLGRATDGDGWLRQALASAERGRVDATIADAAIAWAWNRGTRGDETRAATAFARAAEVLARSPSPWLEAHLWRRRGYLAYRRGDRESAENDMRRAAERFQALGSRRDEAATLGWLGFVSDGRPQRAVPYFERAVGMLEELRDARELGRHLQYLAVFQLEEGAAERAERSFGRALELQARMADRQQEAVTRSRRAILLLERNEPQVAADELTAALRQLDGEGDLLYRGEALAILAAAEAALRLAGSGQAHLEQAWALLEPMHYPALDALRLIRARLNVAAGQLGAQDAGRTLADDEHIDHSYALNRFAHRWLVRSLGGSAPELRLDVDFGWFEWGGKRVSLARRAPMRRILRALVEAQAGGLPLAAGDLVEAGWPGENLVGSSGETRLYTTIRRMRQLGLADVVQHDGTGYRIVGRVVREAE